VDAKDALLARRVAAAADAWLRDPQDTQVYARLVAATLAWRRVTGPTVDETEPMDGHAESSLPMEPDPAVTLPPTLGEALGEVIGKLHLRHAVPDASAKAPTPRALDEDGPHPERCPGDDEASRV
jgi:hypothetical protein